MRRWGRARSARLVAAALVTAAIACARTVEPAALDTANTQCRFCRMTASDVHFAAQIAAVGTEPVFFDDIGCLRDYLKKAVEPVPAGAVAFVADHRTGAWVRAASAVYLRPLHLNTPMGGGIIAHASEDSRRQDPDATGGTPVTAADIFGSAGPPNGGRP